MTPECKNSSTDSFFWDFLKEKNIFECVRTRMWSCQSVEAALLPTRQNSLVFVGRLPQLVCSHSAREVVVLHDVLEVKIWHQLKLEEQRELSSEQKAAMCEMAQCEVGTTFTYIIENFVEVCGVHDEVWISHHVVDSICLWSNRGEAT